MKQILLSSFLLLISILLFNCKKKPHENYSSNIVGVKILPEQPIEDGPDAVGESVASATSVGFVPADGCNCEPQMATIYNTYRVKNSREYLTKLWQMYNYTETKYDEEVKNLGISGAVPGYFKGSYTDNRSRITDIYNKYQGINDFTLTYDEHLDLSKNYISDEVRLFALEKWSECMAGCSSINKIRIVDNSPSEVSLVVDLPVTPINAHLKPKIQDIVLSGHFKENATNRTRVGSRVRYGVGFSLNISKSKDARGFISIQIANDKVISKAIPKSMPEPPCDLRWMNTDEKGNLYRKTAKVKLDYARYGKGFIYASVDGGQYGDKVPLSVNPVSLEILTNLDRDSCRIVDGGILVMQKENRRGVGTNNRAIISGNAINVLSTLSYFKESTELEYEIRYEKLRKVCVQNSSGI